MKLIRDVIQEYTEILKDKSPTSRLDVELLLCEVLDLERIGLMMRYQDEISGQDMEKFSMLFEKRNSGMPIAYILNRKEFMGYDFYVDENVLIPRPDTEVLVEELVEKIISINEEKINVLDMCSGSGAISISSYLISKEREKSNLNMYGVDISEKAIEVSKKNAKKLGADNIKFIVSDLFNSEEIGFLRGNIDIIASNPPYIREEIIPTLDTDVKDFEPMLALSGGDDGLVFYRKITEESTSYLKAGGYLIFEVGHDQAEDVSKIMMENGFSNIYTKSDIQGFERVVVGRLNN